MRQFLKFTLASCLGVFIALCVVFFFGFVFILAAASGSKTMQVSENSILKVAIAQPVPERTNNVASGGFNLDQPDVLGLFDIIKLIDKAAADDKIKGIFLDPTQTSLGIVATNELHRALLRFKESGKFVFAYGNYFSQGGYMLATAADEIYLNPIGSVDFRGFAAFVPFFKNLMDKTDMKMQIYYAGSFKSATEPFRQTEMSPQNRLQTREYLNEVYSTFLQDIASSRNISTKELYAIANDLKSKNSDDALKLNLVDKVAYVDEAEQWMREKLDIENKKKLSYVTLDEYYDSGKLKSDTKAKDRIAVVYAEGEIMPGDRDYGVISDVRYGEIFQKLRKNERVKAVVMRVNSPGGSILASDNLLREIKLLQEAGKPLIVSMGDYAASGGYYISVTADSIFAERNSLTGSIGVFTMIPNPHAMLDNKLGVNFDTVRTGNYSASFSPYFAWSGEEDTYMQNRTDEFYEIFLDRVAEGRNMSREDVHKVAQGRIWSGDMAKTHGLVDANGDLGEAISAAAAMANLDEYRLTEYPKTKNPLDKIIAEITGQDASIQERYVDYQLQKQFPQYVEIKRMLETRDPMARLPVVFSIK